MRLQCCPMGAKANKKAVLWLTDKQQFSPTHTDTHQSIVLSSNVISPQLLASSDWCNRKLVFMFFRKDGLSGGRERGAWGGYSPELTPLCGSGLRSEIGWGRWRMGKELLNGWKEPEVEQWGNWKRAEGIGWKNRLDEVWIKQIRKWGIVLGFHFVLVLPVPEKDQVWTCGVIWH